MITSTSVKDVDKYKLYVNFSESTGRHKLKTAPSETEAAPPLSHVNEDISMPKLLGGVLYRVLRNPLHSKSGFRLPFLECVYVGTHQKDDLMCGFRAATLRNTNILANDVVKHYELSSLTFQWFRLAALENRQG